MNSPREDAFVQKLMDRATSEDQIGRIEGYLTVGVWKITRVQEETWSVRIRPSIFF